MIDKERNTNNHKYDYGDNYRINRSDNVYSHSRRRPKKLIIRVSVLLLSIVFAVSGVVMLYADHLLGLPVYDDDVLIREKDNGFDDFHNTDSQSEDLLTDVNVLNVMLFGTDEQSTGGDIGRSDTMMLVTVDLHHKKIKLTSIMRDLWVPIKGYADAKINAAYSIGGPKLSIDTVERNFGVKIDRYIAMNFNGFAGIVDKLDGIDIELTAKEAATINKFCLREGMPVTNRLNETKGIHHLCGAQALMHSRDRDSGGDDYGRTQRQRNVMLSIVNKIKTTNVAKLSKILTDVGSSLITNFKKNEITKMLSRAITYSNYPVEQYRIPEEGGFYDDYKGGGQQVLVLFDQQQTRKDFASFIYEDLLIEE